MLTMMLPDANLNGPLAGKPGSGLARRQSQARFTFYVTVRCKQEQYRTRIPEENALIALLVAFVLCTLQHCS
jgi:hypothetical protein